MSILVLAVFLSGVLTILSPCVLPVLPFVFARSEQRFLRGGLPLLAGMALSFTAIASLAAVGGSWALNVNQYGRLAALVLLAAFAATLLSRRLSEWLSRPFVALGNRLLPAGSGDASGGGPLSSLLLGIATGLLWAPCAGPILGLVLTGAAISGPSARTTLLLFAYAAGAAVSLAIALLAGGRVFAALKRSLGAGEWIRRVLGVAVLLAVAAIALGWDSSVLTRLSAAGTGRLEHSILTALKPSGLPRTPGAASALGTEGELPSLDGATAWLNSEPLSPAKLRGRVVLVDFWTYSCINCLRTLPYLKDWYAKYKDHGLVILGVHAPEFAFEKDPANVRRAVRELGISYPVALDDRYAIWQAFDNQYWPAHYFIDAAGRVRGHHFGEGQYAETEQTLRMLLTEAGYSQLPPMTPHAAPASASQGVQAAADLEHEKSPETYVGYERASGFASPEGFARDALQNYSLPVALELNQWALAGPWTVDAEHARLGPAPGRIAFHFHARDLHLVLGPAVDGKPVRFRVRLDGADPGANAGSDVDARGDGIAIGERLYQLIRQSGPVADHVFSIEFPDGGVAAYSFTFG